MNTPAPTRAFLTAQIRWARGRGLPAQVAEDVVFESWQHASHHFDASRGLFEPFMQQVVRRRCAYWWRQQGRTQRVQTHLQAVPRGEPLAWVDREQAAAHQEALLAALKPDERQVFGAWALQKHMGKGRIQSAEAAASIGLAPKDYENAKRRLKSRLQRLIDGFGWSTSDLLHGGRHAG
jgi:DNA-directed RNA polymerase specialized sigma24 family protein